MGDQQPIGIIAASLARFGPLRLDPARFGPLRPDLARFGLACFDFAQTLRLHIGSI
ncbi:MAG: hypothetical protein HQM01_06825 [Magnetococcales bacterium]|nr:hypothetical protein [Magnetococcales bacterium]